MSYVVKTTLSTEVSGAFASTEVSTFSGTFDTALVCSQWTTQQYALTSDSAVTVNLSAVDSEANYVSVRVIGSKVIVRITTSDGTSQIVPVDTFFVLRCDSVPITAMTLTRTAGSSASVTLILAKKD